LKITPRNIVKHELIGLEVEVVESRHRGYVGVKGVVVDETMNLLFIDTEKGVKAIPKKPSTFRFKLPDSTLVDVEGWAILARPEDRVKRRIKRRW